MVKYIAKLYFIMSVCLYVCVYCSSLDRPLKGPMHARALSRFRTFLHFTTITNITTTRKRSGNPSAIPPSPRSLFNLTQYILYKCYMLLERTPETEIGRRKSSPNRSTNVPTDDDLERKEQTEEDLGSRWRGASKQAVVLHVLELVHAALGVALADLAQGLVLVAALADVLAVDLVVRRLHGVIPRQGQVLLEGLWGGKKGGETELLKAILFSKVLMGFLTLRAGQRLRTSYFFNLPAVALIFVTRVVVRCILCSTIVFFYVKHEKLAIYNKFRKTSWAKLFRKSKADI